MVFVELSMASNVSEILIGQLGLKLNVGSPPIRSDDLH